jgi:hypothetical protein
MALWVQFQSGWAVLSAHDINSLVNLLSVHRWSLLFMPVLLYSRWWRC